MKNLLIIIFLLPFAAFSQSVTEGLIGYWPLDGNATDQGILSINGTLIGTTPAEDRLGNQASAVAFNGAGDFITLNNIPSTLFSADFTLNLWIKPTSSGTRFVFDKRITDNAGAALILSSGNVLRLSLNSFDALIGGIALTSNEWSHVSVRRSGAIIDFFINGVKQSVSFNSTVDASNNHNAVMGTRSFSTPLNSFGGILDEFMIFERALSDAEISRIYDPEAHSAACPAIFCDGENVAIGTTVIPAGYHLAIDGKAIMEEIKVELSTNWPDYVFDHNYDLKSLDEIAAYIKENGHLPNIPSAEIVSQEGILLGEMNAKLLEKIEELTLYTIDQQSEIKSQKDQLNEQQIIINTLIKRLEKLENK